MLARKGPSVLKKYNLVLSEEATHFETHAPAAPTDDVVEREETTFTTLPVELTAIIFQYLDIRDFYNCLRVCKRFYTILDPKSSFAQHCWASYRKRLGIADPAPLGLSETAFLEKLSTPKCDACKQHPAHPVWPFRGYRICKLCFPKVTIPHSFLNRTLHERQYMFLPTAGPLARAQYGEDVYFRDDIINDHIPDDQEIVHLKAKKERIDRVSKNMPNYPTFRMILAKQKENELDRFRKNVYKWILYKFPMLNAKILDELPEFKTELNKLKSFDTCYGTRLVQLTENIIREKFDQVLVHLVKAALHLAFRPSQEIEDWKTFEPFWKDCLSARTALPSKEELCRKMEKHATGFEEYVQQKYKRIRMIFDHAHDLPMKDVEAIMETDAFKNANEPEIVADCEKLLVAYRKDQMLNAWIEKYDGKSITASCLINQLKNDPIYVGADDEEAFAKLVQSLKSQQAELKIRVNDYFRKSISDSQIYQFFMKLTEPDSVYLKFLVSQSKSNVNGPKLTTRQTPKYECHSCLQTFQKFDTMFKHISTSDFTKTKMLVSQELLSQAKLFHSWMKRLYTITSKFDSDEELFIYRTFWNWVSSEDAFQMFSEHVEECDEFLTKKRSSYQKIMIVVRQHHPHLLSPDSQSKLEERLTEYSNMTSEGQDSRALRRKLLDIGESVKEKLERYHNQKWYLNLFYDEFRSVVEDLNENELENEYLVENIYGVAREMGKKWSYVTRGLSEYKLDELSLGQPFISAIFSKVSRKTKIVDGAVDFTEWKKAIKKGMQLRDEIVQNLKNMIVQQCKLPMKLLDGNEEKKIIFWKAKDTWIRGSLFEFATSCRVVELKLVNGPLPWYRIKKSECAVIGMGTIFSNEPEELKL